LDRGAVHNVFGSESIIKEISDVRKKSRSETKLICLGWASFSDGKPKQVELEISRLENGVWLQTVNVVSSIPEPTPSPTATTSAFSYLLKGGEYYEAENWLMAIDQFTKAIQINPDNASAYINRGAAYVNRGAAYGSLGQYQTAITDYSKVIQLDPDFADAYYARGVCYGGLGQDSRAAADDTKACSLDSQYC